MVYNGTNWKLFPVPNKTILRSIAFGKDGKLYAGAQDEFGFYTSDNLGKLVFTSLKNLLPPSVQSFADIWNIEVTDKEVFFMASEVIFRYSNQKLTFFKPNSLWLSLKKHNNKIIALDSKRGILVFNNEKWETLIQPSALPPGFMINDSKPYGKGTSLISTSGHGLFLLSQNLIRPFTLKNSSVEMHFTSLDVLDKTSFLVGSYNSGLYKINRNGEILDKISTKNGLISNTIRCTYTGFDGTTWIGLDNSIALMDWNNPIRHINPASFNNGSGQGATVFNGELYFALTTGLHWLSIGSNTDLSKITAEPKPVLSGLTWNLSVVGKQLLVGRDDGFWTISGHKAANVSNSSGYWTFKPIPGTVPTKIACGNYFGINLFAEENGKLTDKGKLKNLIESSRYMEVDGSFIWVSHPYHGLFKINWKDNTIKKYTMQHGLPADLDNHVFKLKGKILFATTQGIYEPNNQGSKIIPSPHYQKLLGKKSIRYLKEDQEGNVWFVLGKMLGVIDFKAPNPEVKFIPELHNHLLSGFENIYPYNSENILIGSETGFYNINYAKYREKTLSYLTYVTSVKIIGNGDSIIYGGFNENAGNKLEKVSIPYKFNSLQFAFTTSFLRHKPGTEFSYYLEGYDKNWSNWLLQNEKEYTNLPEGNYIFYVKSRYGPSFEFKEFSYSFRIEAPWYRTVWAYILYFICFTLFIVLLFKFQKKKILKKQQSKRLADKLKFEEEQHQLNQNYQLKLEKKEKAIIQLKNEKLEAELQHKNAELASNAMNLLQKKEFIGKMADELNKVYLPIKDQVDASEIKKILRRLNSEEKLDVEWKQFSIHFNDVHSNFLLTLKEVFPELNAHEMKLCAYLRMNLSSKEIAQLMSISVRGVEISRYRLRKKLKLQPNEDLFGFLFKMKSENNANFYKKKDNL